MTLPSRLDRDCREATNRGNPNREPLAPRRLDEAGPLRVVLLTNGTPALTPLSNRLRRRATVTEIRADRARHAEIEASLRVADAIFAPAATLRLLDGIDLAVAPAPVVCIALERRDAVTAYTVGAVYCVLATATDDEIGQALARVRSRRELEVMATLRRSVAHIAR